MKEIIDEAVRILKAGGVILYPTDTVWGLGCDATNEEAVAKVFAIKRRSEAKSLVLLACDLDMVALHVKEIPSIAIDLVEVNDATENLLGSRAQLATKKREFPPALSVISMRLLHTGLHP